MALAVQLHDNILPPRDSSLRDQALAGFAAALQSPSAKFLYDRRGSELFEQFGLQPEYYLTRSEEAILADAADEIRQLVGPQSNLIELGSGAGRKVRLLLE